MLSVVFCSNEWYLQGGQHLKTLAAVLYIEFRGAGIGARNI